MYRLNAEDWGNKERHEVLRIGVIKKSEAKDVNTCNIQYTDVHCSGLRRWRVDERWNKEKLGNEKQNFRQKTS